MPMRLSAPATKARMEEAIERRDPEEGKEDEQRDWLFWRTQCNRPSQPVHGEGAEDGNRDTPWYQRLAQKVAARRKPKPQPTNQPRPIRNPHRAATSRPMGRNAPRTVPERAASPPRLPRLGSIPRPDLGCSADRSD